MFGLKARKQVSEENGIASSWCNIDQDRPMYTPDIGILESRRWNFIFIPDECMKLGHKHDLVREGASGFFPFYDDCYTSEKFTCLEKHLGKESSVLTFPTINNDELPMWMNKGYRVKGELYALSAKQIISLDNHKKNTVYTERKRININVPYSLKHRTRSQTYNGVWSSTYSSSKYHLTSIEAYAYVARLDYWYDQLLKLDNFRPVKVMQAEEQRIYVNKYYDYKHQE